MTTQDHATAAQVWWKNRYFLGTIGIFAAVLAYLLIPGTRYPQAPIMAAVVTLMATWWILEVIPIPVTSLLPLFLFPALGLASIKQTSGYYGRPIIFLFLGGFLLALGLQQSGLHKRIALLIVRTIGSSPPRLVLGFMVSCGLLSMWISNTASVMVMLPIALSILEELKSREIPTKTLLTFGACLMLAIAYAADIGGMATPIGTPPNLVFLELFRENFPKAPAIGFLSWMAMGLPISLLFMASGWFLLTRFLFPLPKDELFGDKSILDTQLEALGPTRFDEKVAGAVFFFAALLWVTGSDIRVVESFTIPGWRSLLGLKLVTDDAIAIFCATLLFMLPSKDRPGQMMLEWEHAVRVPWGILLLFGGGFAIAGGFKSSGLSQIIGSFIAQWGTSSPIFLVILVCVFLTFLTELSSNTATTTLILPILAKAAVVLKVDPRLLMIPATLSASCAFMMPIASPTQAIVFGSGYVTIRQMMKAGIWFNALGVFLVTTFFLLLGKLILGIDLSSFPTWATP